MKRSTIYSLGLGILLLGLAPTPAMGVTIDLFKSVDQDSSDGNDQPFQGSYVTQRAIRSSSDTIGEADTNEDSGLSDVIGGYRNLSLKVTEHNSPGFDAESKLAVDTTVNQAILSTDPGLLPEATITWDGGDDELGLGGVNLTDGGHDSFLLDIDTDLEVTFTFNVEDTSSNTGSVSQDITTDGQYYFSYNDPGVSAVDFSSIKSISLVTSNEPDSLDFAYNFIETAVEPVPFEFSPSLGIILCGSFFGINKLRKRLQSS